LKVLTKKNDIRNKTIMTFSSLTNASSSWLQQAIEQVTDPTLPTEDWSIIMKICDDIAIDKHRYVIISFDIELKETVLSSAEEAMETIRKKLQTKPVNEGWRSITLTLTVC
jgi:hypothetical protein